MKKYFDILRECPLFNDIQEKDLTDMLSCLGAKIKTYKKNQTILAKGDPPQYLGIVISGTVQIIRVDYHGNRSILGNIEPTQIFGEAFACAGIESMPVDAIASNDAEIMLIDACRITQICSNACGFHNQMIFNLLKVVAIKNILCTQKIEITSKRSTREKLMTYLLIKAKENGSSSFTIPYDRQELADYLEVDRSGLSSEISKMRKDRIIECSKNHFTLL